MRSRITPHKTKGRELMRVMVGILAAASLLLAGCGDSEEGPRSPSVSGNDHSLASVSDEELCAMVKSATIEKAFGQPFPLRAPSVNTLDLPDAITCSYHPEAFANATGSALIELPSVEVAAGAPKADTAAAALASYMTDAQKAPVRYQPVNGLGTIAGYAGSGLGVGLYGGSHLAVILEINGKLIQAVVQGHPNARVEQLRPIADELIKGLEAALR
ncbi:hypothetical protein ACRS5S_03085 [Nocardia asiatica]|uniref:hypothetical protein n=1 Tax=Nocardia asiatica TaxID=209252 RepID=UPI002454E043|nr:hypothetical protein [Nocardia asiatica]